MVEYKINEQGHRVSVTTTTRVRELASARVSKRAVERRGWAKFGDAVDEDIGSRLTMVSREEIVLERRRESGNSPLFIFIALLHNYMRLGHIICVRDVQKKSGKANVKLFLKDIPNY